MTYTAGDAAAPVTDWVHDWDWLDDQWGPNAIEIWSSVREQCAMASTERYGRAFMPVTMDAVTRIAHDTEHSLMRVRFHRNGQARPDYFEFREVPYARFAGANNHEMVDRTVYQAFLTAFMLSVGILAPLGYVLAPSLLELVNATAAVRAEALPFLRIMFLFSIGMLMFFMLGGALRAAGDARTPLRLGIAMTVLNFVLNVVFTGILFIPLERIWPKRGDQELLRRPLLVRLRHRGRHRSDAGCAAP